MLLARKTTQCASNTTASLRCLPAIYPSLLQPFGKTAADNTYITGLTLGAVELACHVDGTLLLEPYSLREI
jgi:hypothetical protein